MTDLHGPVPSTSTSHPHDPIPQDPLGVPQYSISPVTPTTDASYSHSSADSQQWSDSSDSEAASTPTTEPQADEVTEVMEDISELPAAALDFTSQGQNGRRRASTSLISQNAEGVRKILGDGETGTKLIAKYCCGGGCCLMEALPPDTASADFVPVVLPDNDAFRSLNLKLPALSMETELRNVPEQPPSNLSFDPVPSSEPKHVTTVYKHPPPWVQPHAPYEVFSAPVFKARELTKPGAEKRTFHFDLDVTNYPDEAAGVDFRVGGAIGIVPPNATEVVDDVFNCLGIPSFVRDKPVVLRTNGGRWPTIWGEDKPRELVTTRRELLTWCTDLQSNPPTKPLFRLLAEHADALNEKKILTFLTSAQGQATFCDIRTGPHITIPQLLHAFPSSKPPLADLLSVLNQLMPRFYSLSNDPHISSAGTGGRRLIEIAVTVHTAPDWLHGTRTGVGSGFLERIARQYIDAQAEGIQDPTSVLDLRVPVFRGLMSNPLSREFVSDGPMMLVGAGVGMAPFRGFILNRLKNANCANKIWLVQGVRDSSLDEIYRGELGAHESDIKRVVQSRKHDPTKSEARYVQDEVRAQADIVWYVINAIDGRIFVCGSSKGMGEGVEEALVDVAMAKAGLSREEAHKFWMQKKEDAQYIAETW